MKTRYHVKHNLNYIGVITFTPSAREALSAFRSVKDEGYAEVVKLKGRREVSRERISFESLEKLAAEEPRPVEFIHPSTFGMGWNSRVED